MHKLLTFILTTFAVTSVTAQSTTPQANRSPNFRDSATVRVHASYDSVSNIHRWLFGKNYRKDWAIPVKLPVIKISEVLGGLAPLRQGGGLESKSLRLKDRSGKEWVLRSVEKVPDKLLPENFKGTFVVDWIGDEFSGQHPYSALIVPPLAEAARVPHATPVIGVVADDSALGEYRKIFTGLVCLLEEREPIGESDNTLKMERELLKSNDNRLDKEEFLRARLLDLLTGDWDRHEDQWRWAYRKEGKEKIYTAVPRDRDQVFHVNQGVFPSLAAVSWLDPVLDNFDGRIPRVHYSLYKTRFIKAFPDAQFSYEDWMRVTREFVAAENDEVLEAGLKRLPTAIYQLRHDELLKKLKERRNNIPAAMAEYYKFIFKIADLQLSDKDEQVTISDAPAQGMRVVISKSGKSKGTVMDMTYHPDVTKEIRLYLSAGDDQVIVNNTTSPIKLRLIGNEGQKVYDVKAAKTKVKVYSRTDSVQYLGQVNRIIKYPSNDTLNTHFVPTNLYNVWMPLATAAINADDGFLLGLGFKYTHQEGFRKTPYTDVQQLMLTHSFATDAFRIRYQGEWIAVLGKADFTTQAVINAPNNTTNFFGLGNETSLNKFKGYRRYYRTRYNTYELDPALRWHLGTGNSLSVGPSFQYYHLDLDDNNGRFIHQSSLINSYDSATVNKDKVHLGIMVNYNSNQRNNNILPSQGYYLNVTLQGYTGLNSYSKSFVQLRPEFTYYQKLNAQGTFVVSDRVGGGITLGKPAFYQAMFLGGQGNLLGYLQNRFAGQQMLFNNLQARIKLANVAGYILPGQLGITGFYDAGRVWISDEHSDKWHQGTGGGLYFSPASLTIIQVLAGHSTEGWYPYISFNFRL